MWPGVEDLVLTAAIRRARHAVDLVAPTAVDLNALDADVLAEIEIIVGSWGCNTSTPRCWRACRSCGCSRTPRAR